MFLDTLKSDVHDFFLGKGFTNISRSIYEKDNIKIEFEDFYHRIFKYYENNELKYINKDNNLGILEVRNILRNISINNLLDK